MDEVDVPELCPLETEQSEVADVELSEVEGELKCLKITDNEACDPLEIGEICVEKQKYGQCLQGMMHRFKRSTDNGKWLKRDCPQGTVCVMNNNKVECQDERTSASDCE